MKKRDAADGGTSPTIEDIFREFLKDQRKRLKPKTFARYDDVIDLLRGYLDRDAYQALSKGEAALIDSHYGEEGEGRREFCQLFGPDKIVENLSGFLGYYLIRNVVAGEELNRAAGTVTKKLSKWLAEKGYIEQGDAQEGAETGAQAARDLPKVRKASRILFDEVERAGVDTGRLNEEDYLEFDHFTIARLEPGKLWLDALLSGNEVIGPVPVPAAATALLQQGWSISCSIGRVRGGWQIVEMGNVYP